MSFSVGEKVVLRASLSGDYPGLVGFNLRVIALEHSEAESKLQRFYAEPWGGGPPKWYSGSLFDEAID